MKLLETIAMLFFICLVLCVLVVIGSTIVINAFMVSPIFINTVIGIAIVAFIYRQYMNVRLSYKKDREASKDE